MKNKRITNLLGAALVAAAWLPVSTARAGDNSPWSLDTSLNLFLAGMSGDVTAKGVPTHVNASFSQIVDHLDAGAAGRVTVGYDRWVLSTEFSYLKLKAEPSAATVNLEQWLVEPSLGYRLCDHCQVFVGGRYNNISGSVTFTGPAGRVATGTQDWWDPILGTQLSFPLIGKSLTLDGRFDVGGFGAGSDVTWQAFPYLSWRFSKWGSAQAGYRWLGTDYKTGSGASEFRYDVIAQGPQIGFSLHF